MQITIMKCTHYILLFRQKLQMLFDLCNDSIIITKAHSHNAEFCFKDKVVSISVGRIKKFVCCKILLYSNAAVNRCLQIKIPTVNICFFCKALFMH